MEDFERQIVMVVDGGIGEGHLELATVTRLAKVLQHREHGDFEVTEVFALSQLNELKQVQYTVTGGGEFDENDLATVVVTVVFPDGHRESASYVVDGRA